MTEENKKCTCGKDCKCGKECNCDKCKTCAAHGYNIIPICILASMLTAVLVTLVFAISLVQSFKLEPKANANYAGKFSNETTNATIDENDGIILSGGALVNFFETEQTGFILATSPDCGDRCNEIAVRIRNLNSLKEPITYYRYHYDENASDSKAESDAAKLVLYGSEAPVFLYVRNGVIFDRLDDVDSVGGLTNFINKYR